MSKISEDIEEICYISLKQIVKGLEAGYERSKKENGIAHYPEMEAMEHLATVTSVCQKVNEDVSPIHILSLLTGNTMKFSLTGVKSAIKEIEDDQVSSSTDKI